MVAISGIDVTVDAEKQLMSFMAISTITIRYLIVNNNESQNKYSFWLSIY